MARNHLRTQTRIRKSNERISLHNIFIKYRPKISGHGIRNCSILVPFQIWLQVSERQSELLFEHYHTRPQRGGRFRRPSDILPGGNIVLQRVPLSFLSSRLRHSVWPLFFFIVFFFFFFCLLFYSSFFFFFYFFSYSFRMLVLHAGALLAFLCPGLLFLLGRLTTVAQALRDLLGMASPTSDLELSNIKNKQSESPVRRHLQLHFLALRRLQPKHDFSPFPGKQSTPFFSQAAQISPPSYSPPKICVRAISILTSRSKGYLKLENETNFHGNSIEKIF